MNKQSDNITQLLESMISKPDDKPENLTYIEGNFTKITSHPDYFFPMPGKIGINEDDEIEYIETHGQGMTIGVKVSDLQDHITIIFKAEDKKIYTKKGDKIEPELTTKEIAQANDEFRIRVLTSEQKDGKGVMTIGIDELPSTLKLEAFIGVIEFDDFNEDNDPDGQHNYGCFTINEDHKEGEGPIDIAWQIDSFRDESCATGNDSNTNLGYRVLTVMLPHER